MAGSIEIDHSHTKILKADGFIDTEDLLSLLLQMNVTGMT